MNTRADSQTVRKGGSSIANLSHANRDFSILHPTARNDFTTGQQMTYKYNLMESFENDIRHSFPYLFEDWGFEFVNVEDDYSGNIAVAQSGTLRIGFARDRADFHLDFFKVDEPDVSVGFYEIMDRLRTEGRLKTGFKYSNKMSHVSRFLEQNISEILKSAREELTLSE